jgi:hypothetical protein
MIGLSVTVRTRSITLFAIAAVDIASNTSQQSSPTMIAECVSHSAVNA